ncbi:MAG: glycosyltransferase family 39 protein [Gemmataceae bacterium]
MDRALDTVSGTLAHLWSRVLFPAAPPPIPERPSRRSLVVLLVLPAVLLYPMLSHALIEPDESRYAQIPYEMLQRGDWVVPTLQSEPYLDKPPLFYWLVMLSYSLLGVGPWQARLVPALCVHATLLAVYLVGRRSVGERPALLAALLLMVAPGFMVMSRLLILDGLLMLLTTLALLCALEAVRGPVLHTGWWWASGVACGLGVLCKGPVIGILVAAPLALYATRLSWHLSGQDLSRQAWLQYLLVVLAISGPWYVALGVRQPEFLPTFFWEHNLERFLAPGIHVKGVWFYGPVVFGVLFPATLLAWPLGRFLLSRDTADARTPELAFHLVAGGWCVLFFTLSSCKLPTYILPAMPFLALVFGVFLSRTGWERGTLTRSVALAGALTVAGIHWVGLPWYANYRSPMAQAAVVRELCAEAPSVVCYPRGCDSVAFALGRSDLTVYRSKEIEALRTLVRVQPRTVILCTHRSSLQGLKQLLPPEVRIVREEHFGLRDLPGVPAALMKPFRKLMGETALGLGDICVVEFPPLLAQQPPPDSIPISNQAKPPRLPTLNVPGRP